MKKITLIFTLCSLFFGVTAQAQSEVKGSPLILLEIGLLSYEYGFNDNVGIEGTLIGFFGEYGFAVAGKYYLSPSEGLDRMYIGSFVSGISNYDVGIGLFGGTKMVTDTGMLFEVGIGIGRLIDDELIAYFKLDVGYRF